MAILPLILAFASPSAAQTGGVQVTPVIIAMNAEPGLSSLRVRNWRPDEVAFEVEVLTWNQEDGEDVLAPTTELVVAPSVFAIAPDEEQIVRLALTPARQGAPPQRELSYRLLLRELPPPAGEDAGFRVQLQMSLPVFISPRPALAELAARRVTLDGAGSSIVLENTGSAHLRLASATYGAGETSLARLPRYLLAGSRITRPVPREESSIMVVYAGADAQAPITETFELAPATPVLRR